MFTLVVYLIMIQSFTGKFKNVWEWNRNYGRRRRRRRKDKGNDKHKFNGFAI